MANRKKPTPKTQRQLSQEQITPYEGQGKVPLSQKKSRAEQRSVRGDDVKNFTIGLKDIDEAIIYYFNNVLRPSVIQNGQKTNVPILYGSPERWASVQKDGFYRDKNGKIQVPLIMFKRDSLEKNRTLGNKLDGNEVNNFIIYQKKYSKRNIYDSFSRLTNRNPSQELYAVVIPDYVTVRYSCVIYTDYVEQMNKLVESINFASDSYWGDPEKFKFRAMIDSYTTATELNQGSDRAVKTTFTINLNGYIITDAINKELANMRKFYSKSRIDFKLETAGTLEELTARAGTAEAQASTRFFDQTINSVGGGTATSNLTSAEIIFINAKSTTVANTKSGQLATFNGKSFLTPPAGFPSLTVEDFEVYVNGRRVPSSQINSITEVGVNIEVNINTPAFFEQTGAVLEAEDEVLLVGKIQ